MSEILYIMQHGSIMYFTTLRLTVDIRGHAIMLGNNTLSVAIDQISRVFNNDTLHGRGHCKILAGSAF